MALIKFTNNYEDLSTDQGYQFKFYCDKCGNGYMSRFQPSALGTAGSVLRGIGNLFGGWASSAGNSTYDLQRAVGGKAHDNAMAEAVEEGKQHFHQCSRCGRWVCPEACWNAAANQCEECAPNYQEEVASAAAQAKAEAVRMQLQEKARQMDYASSVDMSPGAVASAPGPAKPQQKFCPNCGAAMAGKFCGECGSGFNAKPKCTSCGHQPESPTKFCPECGGKMA